MRIIEIYNETSHDAIKQLHTSKKYVTVARARTHVSNKAVLSYKRSIQEVQKTMHSSTHMAGLIHFARDILRDVAIRLSCAANFEFMATPRASTHVILKYANSKGQLLIENTNFELNMCIIARGSTHMAPLSSAYCLNCTCCTRDATLFSTCISARATFMCRNALIHCRALRLRPSQNIT